MDRKRLTGLARGSAHFDPWLELAGARNGALRLLLACCALASACDEPLDSGYGQIKRDAGQEDQDTDTEEETEPEQEPDADAEDAGEPEPTVPSIEAGGGADDSAVTVADATSVVADAGRGDGGPPVISAPVEVMQALCSDAYDSVKLTYSEVTRGSWQFNPGGTFVKLSQAGYPCHAFLEEKKLRPLDSDKKWSDAADGAFLGFSEPSAISTMDYADAQFRYFRSFIFVPMGANLKSLSVKALGIDDSVYLELTNSRYPMGTSPRDVGPSDPEVGACQGNGNGEWNLAKYMAEGEINVLLVVHADLAAATSTLLSVDVRADGAPIQLVSCKK